MKIVIVKADNLVEIDGVPVIFDYSIADNIWAVQWNGSTGVIEYTDGTANEAISSMDEFQAIIDGHGAAFSAQQVETASQATADFAAKPYRDQRAISYPPVGDQLDALFHAGAFTAEMTVTIQDVKDLYPKT